MSHVGTVITILFGAFMLLMVVVLLLEIPNAREDAETYERVYDMSSDEYIDRLYLPITLFGAGVLLSLMPFIDRKRAKRWQAVIYVTIVLLLAFSAYNFYIRALSGFDH